MSSLHLRIRKSDKEITEASSHHIKVDDTGNDFYCLPIWLKKVGDGVFAELYFNDLPEAVKKQIDKTEKIY